MHLSTSVPHVCHHLRKRNFVLRPAAFKSRTTSGRTSIPERYVSRFLPPRLLEMIASHPICAAFTASSPVCTLMKNFHRRFDLNQATSSQLRAGSRLAYDPALRFLPPPVLIVVAAAPAIFPLQKPALDDFPAGNVLGLFLRRLSICRASLLRKSRSCLPATAESTVMHSAKMPAASQSRIWSRTTSRSGRRKSETTTVGLSCPRGDNLAESFRVEIRDHKIAFSFRSACPGKLPSSCPVCMAQQTSTSHS